MRGLVAICLVFTVVLSPGCAYRIGSGLAAGILDEAGTKGDSPGVSGVVQDVYDRELLLELGRQLGEGLIEGASELNEDQRASLEATVDGLLTVTATSTARGLRDEVSPELREMIRRDIVGAFNDGLRNDLSDSLDRVVDRTVARAVASLKTSARDEEISVILADRVREGVYLAVQDGRPGSPGVAETLETTFENSLLTPFESTVGSLTEDIADQVDKSAQRTENTLKTVISALVVILGVFVLMYALTRRQLLRARQSQEVAQRDLRSLDAAMELLDEEVRAQVRGKMDEYRKVSLIELEAPPAEDPEDRSNDYDRTDDPPPELPKMES